MLKGVWATFAVCCLLCWVGLHFTGLGFVIYLIELLITIVGCVRCASLLHYYVLLFYMLFHKIKELESHPPFPNASIPLCHSYVDPFFIILIQFSSHPSFSKLIFFSFLLYSIVTYALYMLYYCV